MKVKDINLAAALLTLPNVKLLGWKKEERQGKIFIVFELTGLSNNEFTEKITDFFLGSNDFKVVPKVFMEKRNYLKNIIAQATNYEDFHQGPEGEIEKKES